MVAAAQHSNSRPRSVKMVDLSKQDNIISQPTSVHCEKDVRCWKSLGSILSSLVIPCCCGCKLHLEPKIRNSPSSNSYHIDSSSTSTSLTATNPISSSSSSATTKRGASTTVTGTIFGHRKGKVSMSIQEDPKDSPVILLELAIPTFVLVKEMSSGLLRIALECDRDPSMTKPLYSEPVWTMFCNGRRAGYAMRRPLSDSDRAVLGLMQSVSMGAGVIPLPSSESGEEMDELMYMRATYERVVGSQDSESFHMINPDGSPGQELSIFLLRA